jgi:hypothetical protein
MFMLARELDLFLLNLVTPHTINSGEQLSFTLFYVPTWTPNHLQRAEEQKPLKNNGRITSHEKPLE